jgi:hypothetical protein
MLSFAIDRDAFGKMTQHYAVTATVPFMKEQKETQEHKRKKNPN